MQSEKKLFDDLAKVAGGAFDALAGVKNDMEARMRQQMEGWMARFQMVTREEHEAVLAMAAAAREAQEQLHKRVAALEAKLGIVAKPAAAPKAAAAKMSGAKPKAKSAKPAKAKTAAKTKAAAPSAPKK